VRPHGGGRWPGDDGSGVVDGAGVVSVKVGQHRHDAVAQHRRLLALHGHQQHLPGTSVDTDRFCGFTVTHAPRNVPCGYYTHQATYKLTAPTGTNSLYVRGAYLCIP